MTYKKFFRNYLLFIAFFLFLSIELPIIIVGYTAHPAPSDTIIVLGAKLMGREPSTMLRLRLNEAIHLYQDQYASTIIVSGAQGIDEEVSEAFAMQAYLINHGIPAEKILLEDQSFNTFQNLYNSNTIMKKYGYKNAIIVSNASHIRRALTLAHNIGMNATASPAPMADNLYLTAKQYLREGAAMLSLLTTKI